jgi:hypothetical protein
VYDSTIFPVSSLYLLPSSRERHLPDGNMFTRGQVTVQLIKIQKPHTYGCGPWLLFPCQQEWSPVASGWRPGFGPNPNAQLSSHEWACSRENLQFCTPWAHPHFDTNISWAFIIFWALWWAFYPTITKYLMNALPSSAW